MYYYKNYEYTQTIKQVNHIKTRLYGYLGILVT